MEYLSGNYYAIVDKGMVRKSNEDSATGVLNAYGNVLLMVADGMGGAAKGEYASNTLVKTIAPTDGLQAITRSRTPLVAGLLASSRYVNLRTAISLRQ